jgi:hypothetical protein
MTKPLLRTLKISNTEQAAPILVSVLGSPAYATFSAQVFQSQVLNLERHSQGGSLTIQSAALQLLKIS